MSLLAALASGMAIGMGLWLAVLAIRGRIVVGARSAAAHRRPRSTASSLFDPRDGVFAIVAHRGCRRHRGHDQAGGCGPGCGRRHHARAPGPAGSSRPARAVAKMRAAAEFVESIRGSLGAGSGLEAAIVESARRPPAGLADELTDFVALRRLPEVTTEDALRRLADRADEPAVDLLVGSLLAALRGGAGDMGRLFERIADQGREFADTRAQTQAERARVEFQTRILSLLVVFVGLLSVVVSPDLTSVYGPSFSGQVLLAIPVIVFALGWWWLITMNRVESQYRFRLRPARVEASGDAR